MDLLRAAVGDEQINYYGISYGTHVGAVYANLFPERVRAVTLDAVLDPVEWTTGETPQDAFVPFTARLGSPDGARAALESFLAACAADARCAFREPGVDLLAKFDRLRAALRGGPVQLPTPSGPMPLDYQELVGLTLGSLYSAGASTALGEVLQQVADAVDGAEPTDAGPMRRLAEATADACPTYLGPEQFAG